MKKEFVFPIQCRRCGMTFDLWYEFIEADERLNNPEIIEKLGKKLEESLCWDCKQSIIRRIRAPEKEDPKEIDELILELSYEE